MTGEWIQVKFINKEGQPLTIKELKQYRDLQKEIQDLESRIKNAVVLDTVKGSDIEFPYTLHSRKLEGVPDSDNTYRVQLLKAKLKCKQEFQKLNDFINSIDDSQLRRIFRYKFIDGYTWTKTAMLIGGGNTAECLIMKVKRYFKKSA